MKMLFAVVVKSACSNIKIDGNRASLISATAERNKIGCIMIMSAIHTNQVMLVSCLLLFRIDGTQIFWRVDKHGILSILTSFVLNFERKYGQYQHTNTGRNVKMVIVNSFAENQKPIKIALK